MRKFPAQWIYLRGQQVEQDGVWSRWPQTADCKRHFLLQTLNAHPRRTCRIRKSLITRASLSVVLVGSDQKGNLPYKTCRWFFSIRADIPQQKPQSTAHYRRFRLATRRRSVRTDRLQISRSRRPAGARVARSLSAKRDVKQRDLSALYHQRAFA